MGPGSPWHPAVKKMRSVSSSRWWIMGAETNLLEMVMPPELSPPEEMSTHLAVAAGFRILNTAIRAIWPALFSSGELSLH